MLQHLLLSLVAFSLLFSPWRGPVGKSYSADRFDVDVAVQADGSLVVTERLTLRFVGGPFTYVYRHLPVAYTDGIDVISASVDGVSLPEGKEAGQVEIAGRDPVKVTWHFAPTSDSTHTFDLTYRVWGVIRKETDADVLIWQALPDEYEYSIAASTIRVTYPETVSLLGVPEVQQGTATVEQGANMVTFDARDLKPNSTLIVVLRFGAGSLIATPPQWQTRGTSNNSSGLVLSLIAATVVALVVIMGAVFVSRARTPSSARGETPLTLPPSDLPPAIAGVLLRNGSVDTTWAWAYALGACFDLARRGVIGIEEVQRTSWLRGRDFVFRLNVATASLRPHERGVIEMLFSDKSGLQSEVRLSKLQNTLYRRLKPFTEALKTECESLGFFDAERQRRRKALIVWGVILMLAGVALMVGAGLMVETLGVLPILGAIGVDVFGFVLLIVGASLSPLGDDTQQTALEWKSFAKYLGDVTRRRDTLLHRDQFEGYLPYAAAFGLAEPWSRYLKKHEDVEVPAWFRALATAEDNGRGAFVAMIAASGSAGGTGASGAAGGAAGGGASGAG
ncbi:MAG TPA: DUF2207 domain-containing protein [Anaerolineae bacterium]|nr:DUF2207 domain-containing protein [Anaerolineae bacterium]HQK15416.1 DUF2207 domain-containing protein [Anaerolineae bacterium]